jgi:hypothetical protein
MNHAWTAIGIATLVGILATAPALVPATFDQTVRLWGKLHGDCQPMSYAVRIDFAAAARAGTHVAASWCDSRRPETAHTDS